MSKQQNIIGYVFKERYEIKSKLKSGGFASVYIAKDLKQKNRFVAVKIMDPKSKFYAEVEFKMYEKIKEQNFTFGFVKHFDHGLQNNKYFIIMELLDRDLDQIILIMKSKTFTLKTVLMIGLQVIDRLEAFHKIGYLHRDIKPDNLVIGFQEKNKIIYLIDFGLAKKIDELRPQEKGKLLGSLGYMSCRAHQGKLTGPADDIESLMYSLLHLLAGTLPWSKLKINTMAQTHKILIMKKKISKNDFKGVNVPTSFFEIIQTMKKTAISQRVDYLMIKYKMLEMLKSIKAQNDFIFDWSNLKTLSPEKFGKKRQISPQKIERQKQKEQNQKQIQQQIYQVYKFLDSAQDKQRRSEFKKQKIVSKKILNEKYQNQASQQKIQKKQLNIKQENQDSRKIRPLSAAHKKPLNQFSKTIKTFSKITQAYNLIKYEGPNIVINKTAKHKI